MKAIIIDDELLALEALKNDLQRYCPNVSVMAAVRDSKEGLMAIRKLKPDIVFLDVAMPWMNGFEMLELLPAIDFSLIIISAHEEYAARAFRACAIDYLLKPIVISELMEAVAKVETHNGHKSQDDRIVTLLQAFNKRENRKITIPVKEGYEFLEPDNMVCLKADGAYTNIMLLEGRNLLVSKSIGELMELLPQEDFTRIHHSTVVNQRYITHFIRADGGYVQLVNGERLMVSKSRRDHVLHQLGLK